MTQLVRFRDQYAAGLLIGLAGMVAAVVLLFPEQFRQCFNEDGTETRELARSLRTHFLPCWELETRDEDPLPGGQMGTVVVNPSLVNSYWTCGLQVLLGDNELATRLPYWIWWGAIFAVLLHMVGPSWRAALPLALLMLLVSLLFTFYVGYNPYMADIANPGVTDALFTLCMLLGFDALRQQDRGGWTISMLLACLVLYAGPVMLALMLPAMWLWKPIPRRETLCWGLSIAAALLAVACFYLVWGWRDGSLPVWIDTLDIEYVQHYLSAVPRWKSGALFFGYFLLGCGGLPALGLWWAFFRDAWQRTVATTTLLYLLVVLCSGFKNLHFLAPLWPIPILLFLLPVAPGTVPIVVRRLWWRRRKWDCPPPGPRAGVPMWKTLAATASLLLCIALAWPAARATFATNRQLGQQTTILTGDYLKAVTWARVRIVLKDRGLMSWDCDEHTWVAYAELDAAPEALRPLVLTDGRPPAPGYRLLAERPVEGTAMVARLYARDSQWAEWLKQQQPVRPLPRYPVIFRPLADGPYSPHNNSLDDVPRLHWLVPRLRRFCG
jgi:hypothetical protein